MSVRIAIDATPLALGPRRGVARALTELLRGLSRAPPPGGVVLLAPRALPPDVALPFPVLLPPRPVATARRFRRRLGALLERAEADVLVVPWSAFPRVDRPVVVTVHELPFVRWGPIEGRVRAWRHRAWLRRAVRRAAAIVVPSHATRRDLLELEPDADAKVHVVPNPFDPTPWTRAGRDAVAAGGSPPSGRLVAVGCGPRPWAVRKKGLDVLVAAIRRLGRSRVSVVLVGDPPRRLVPGCEVLGGVDDAQLRRLVAGSTALVHPARSEGFGYPPLEAFAAGVPVVASDGGSLPEVVGDAALLTPAGDAEALAAALGRILDEPDLRADLVRRGRVRAGRFPPEASAARLAAICEAVTSDAAGGAT